MQTKSQLFVIVNGAPGTGKTTLSKKLAKDLNLPCLNKDDVKELLFDKMGVGDLKWSQDLGAGVAEMLFSFAERWLERRRSLIVESAFFVEFAAPRFKDILAKNDCVFLEVYCKTDGELRRKRFVERNQNGQRHPGHIDHNHINSDESEEAIAAKYARLQIGEVLEVDTTSFDEADYRELLVKIRATMGINQKEGKV